jgi:hypothetical protein
MERFTSVRFRNFKAYENFSLSLDRFNVLCGPNNSGKSTILSAFRILSEGMRKARSRKPALVRGPDSRTWGYRLDLSEIDFALENVFHNYDDSTPASVRFRLSNANELILFFPNTGECNLTCESASKIVTSPSRFKELFDVSIGFVPILGPVDHNEPLYQKEAARLALLSYRAARNFRNIWHHYPEGFDDFRGLIKQTWPGMDIEPPEVDQTHDKPLLRMFCPEQRIPREIFWSGFGFQVWCQMLTYLTRNKDVSLFLIDEPDIYLHADLQRQLVGILRTIGPDILIATHSTEMLSECDSDEIVLVSKENRSGVRVKRPNQIASAFLQLGSNLNPILTQIARFRKVLFVEGQDFSVLSKFASRLGETAIANRSQFAVIPVEGFNPPRVKDFKAGIEFTLGIEIESMVIFDRDYRSDEECQKQREDLSESNRYVHIHDKKEIENYLIAVSAIETAFRDRVENKNTRTGRHESAEFDVKHVLHEIAEELKGDTLTQKLSWRRRHLRSMGSPLDDSSIDRETLERFNHLWSSLDGRLSLVSGKEILARLNRRTQESNGVTLTPSAIIKSMKKSDIPSSIVELVSTIRQFVSDK